MPSRVHILVLNHNGRMLLAECMPSVVACARGSERSCRVTVIDNDSADASVEFLRRTGPDVRVLRMANRGLVSFNAAAEQADEHVLLLLNNDVKLAAGCIDRLAETVETRTDCFLAGPLCWTFDGKYEGTRSELRFHRGLVHTRLARDFATAAGVFATNRRGAERERATKTATASAGAVLAVSREKFLALGGFDSLFLPGRFEDLDFAFRGWLAGWKAYYVPDAVAYHRGSPSFESRFGARELQSLDVRNALLFAWKNLTERRHVAEHLAFLVLRIVRAAATGRLTFLRGLVAAARRLPEALRRRATATRRVLSEREVFQMLAAERLDCSTAAPA